MLLLTTIMLTLAPAMGTGVKPLQPPIPSDIKRVPPPVVMAMPPPPVMPPAPVYIPAPPPPGGGTPPSALNPEEWVTTDDYPSAALRAEAEGRVRARLTIGTDGLVDDCSLDLSSGNIHLDTRTCIVLTQRARFDPGRDASGTAVEAQVIVPILWRMPDYVAPAPVPDSLAKVSGW